MDSVGYICMEDKPIKCPYCGGLEGTVLFSMYRCRSCRRAAFVFKRKVKT